MKWIVLAIVLCVVPYTFVTLHYRKSGPAFEPYHDMKDRANTLRLLSAGYQRVTLGLALPADPLRHPVSAPIKTAPGGLPEELKASLVEFPVLPVEVTRVSAPPTTEAASTYTFRFGGTLPDDHRAPGSAMLYVKGERLLITPHHEKLGGALAARSRENVWEASIPAGVLKPGRYEATIVGDRTSRSWTLEVR